MKKKYITPKVELVVIDAEDTCGNNWEGNWGGSKGWGDGNGHYHKYNGQWVDENGNVIKDYNPTDWGANNSKPSPWVNDVMDDW